MKKLLLLIAALAITCSVKSQIYSSDPCFYVSVNEDIANASRVGIVMFKGERLYVFVPSGWSYSGGFQVEKERVVKLLKQNPTSFDNIQNYSKDEQNHKWVYDSSLSTTKREVYKNYSPAYYSPFWGRYIDEQTEYYAVSPDKSSIIYWVEENGRISGTKSYYIKIDKEQLLPKAINRDFLYE